MAVEAAAQRLGFPKAGCAPSGPAALDYIEVFYNRQQLHSALAYVNPAAYEQQQQAA